MLGRRGSALGLALLSLSDCITRDTITYSVLLMTKGLGHHFDKIAVTACIDRIDFHYPVFVGNLLTLKASINMVGNTSMEVGVRIESEDLFSDEVLQNAFVYLTLVALLKNRRPKTGAAAYY